MHDNSNFEIKQIFSFYYSKNIIMCQYQLKKECLRLPGGNRFHLNHVEL